MMYRDLYILCSKQLKVHYEHILFSGGGIMDYLTFSQSYSGIIPKNKDC